MNAIFLSQCLGCRVRRTSLEQQEELWSERLSGACNALRSLDASALGAPPLIDAVHDFADGWHYGITQIGERADSAVCELGRVGAGFAQCDAALAAACRPVGDER